MFRVRVERLADGSNLSDVIMRKAEVTGVVAARLDLRRADLRKTRIDGCALTDAHMGGVRLAGAVIVRTRFVRCDLRGADLRKVGFDDVEFVDCDLDGVLLGGAWRGGDLVLPGYEVPLRA